MATQTDDLEIRVERRLDDLRRLLRTHAGSIDLLDLSPDGVVRVRLTGLCTACPLKPVTVTGTVRPALMSVDGVEAVEAEGACLSEEAEARLRAHLSEYGSRSLLRALDVDESHWVSAAGRS
jgi:Fe-S cluster biogenesis protein NfuA